MKQNLQLIRYDVILGENVNIRGFVNLYDCTIGDNTKIGTFVEIGGASIGKNCKICTHTYICPGVAIEDNVFIGHNVSFINDKYPRAVNKQGELQTGDDWRSKFTRVRKGASIGSGSTILCDVMIGENSIVGAGSVVTKSVPANVIVAGNPAVYIRSSLGT